MKSIYESFVWWLILWLPSKRKSFLAWVVFSCYYPTTRAEPFWDTLAIPRRSNSPWARQWERKISWQIDEDNDGLGPK